MRKKHHANALMLQGTHSNAGKSLIVTALCRAYARRGIHVAPFKPQNMSTNAAITREGGEISRAQALQARACRLEPRNVMNPLLLKPQSGHTTHIILNGAHIDTTNASTWMKRRADFLPAILDAYQRLCKEYDLILVEGAGSPAEANLPPPDIANMAFAEASRIPVLLIASIDRGGVLASITGTHLLLSPQEQRRVKGYIINQFRGQRHLLDPAFPIIKRHTSWPCYGIVPFMDEAQHLPLEDSLSLKELLAHKEQTERQQRQHRTKETIHIAVPLIPHLANSDDFDPLRSDPQCQLSFVPPQHNIPPCDIIILPGSKSVIRDMQFIRQQGWDIDIYAHVRQKKHVLGLCGGYQMLGHTIEDPQGIEGIKGQIKGLGLLDVTTRLMERKILAQSNAIHVKTQQYVHGYEIHMGITKQRQQYQTMLAPCHTEHKNKKHIDDHGTTSPCGLVEGCYLHALFANDGFRNAYIQHITHHRLHSNNRLQYQKALEDSLDRLAHHIEQAIDLDALQKLASTQEPP
ncbi:MAG: cobyric acid synthase [Alphaproteobacteria bacterium GM7ARS4]|nr:cobyric acid synthase [Alphaproteobacteria bacterium GM7ARS4]